MRSTVIDRIRERTSPEIKQRVKFYCEIIVALANEETCLMTGSMEGEYDEILLDYIDLNRPNNIKWK